MNGKIIKEIRKQKGLTQKEVYTDVASKTFYSDFEAGKHSVEVEKFRGFLNNLGISQTEFDFFKDSYEENTEKILEDRIEQLYKKGDFEALYEIFENYQRSPKTELRYLAIESYLLVLITNTNFYKFSRAPFAEIIAYLDGTKMWTLKEIKLSKLIILSFSEKEQQKELTLYQRIVAELEKYKVFDPKRYYEEIGDLHFNRIQHLLMVNEIEEAEINLKSYSTLIAQSDNLYLTLQLRFITCIVNSYLNFPSYSEELKDFLDQMSKTPTSETHFYKIIAQLHLEKAKNFYQRYQK